MSVGQTAVVRRAQKNGSLIRGIAGELDRTSWTPPRVFSPDEWKKVGSQFALAGHSVMWWLGDWLNHGERQWKKTYEEAAEITGYAISTLRQAAQVGAKVHIRICNLPWEHHNIVSPLSAEEQKEWLAKAEENEWSCGKLRAEIRRSRGHDTTPIEGIYRVVYADPPWDYGNKGLDDYGHADRHYKSMSIDELCAMPVAQHVEENAVLFLWVTSPLLDECWKIIEAWGFEYRTSFIWDKVKHNHGHYNSVRHELLLVCARGSCTPEIPDLHDSVISIERGEHSEKPEYFAELIDKLYPSGNRIELFARRERKGWKVWGNEV